MRNKILLQTTLLMLGLVGFISCEEEPDNTTELILGRWEIEQAYRNGEQTESLDELFFEFYQDQNMRTNLIGSPEDAIYEVDDNQIKQRESTIDADYTIEELSDSTLVMTTDLQNTPFRFILHKVVQVE